MKGTTLKFRDNLLHLRQQRNMTQEQLAMLLGVSRQSVAKWESGQSTPEVDKLVKMADLFGCSLDEFVSGDLTTREVAPAEVLPEDAPPADICDYDSHKNKFAFGIATGVGLIIGGVAVAMVPVALAEEHIAEIIAPVCILAFVAIGLAFILPAALGHAAFAKAHPFVEDFYTPAQKEAEHRSFTIRLTIGIILILLGVIAVIVASLSTNLAFQAIGAAVLLALIAIGVWSIVYGSIIHALTDVDYYNRERADEQWERDNPRVGRICGIIMLSATAIGLLMLFLGTAAAEEGVPHAATVVRWFWLVWPIGGIACGITTAAMKAAANK